MKTLTRALAGATSAAVLAVLAVLPAQADPPPAAVGNTFHGFVVADGRLRTIDHPRATSSPATPDGSAGTGTSGINDRGDILGLYEDRRDGIVRHFVLDRLGRFTTIAPPRQRPPGMFDELVDINNRGEIVGFYNDDQGATTTSFLRTRNGRYVDIRYPGAQVTGVLKINDRRQAVGIYVDDTGVHGLLWNNGRYRTVDVPDAATTVPTGINNRGQIVGSTIDKDGAYHGFVRDPDGDVTTLPEAPGSDPAGGGTQPASINDRGQIVGLAYDANGGSRAFRFERGRYTMYDGPKATYTRALDVNNYGRIVGDYGTKPAPADPGNVLLGIRVQR
jgi:probable HAF family extracellular repeat protein